VNYTALDAADETRIRPSQTLTAEFVAYGNDLGGKVGNCDGQLSQCSFFRVVAIGHIIRIDTGLPNAATRFVSIIRSGKMGRRPGVGATNPFDEGEIENARRSEAVLGCGDRDAGGAMTHTNRDEGTDPYA
jgi:hypothetical protein